MEALVFVFYLGILILYVWMIVLFVNMAKDVKEIRQRGEFLGVWSIAKIKSEVKLSILEGTQDKVYLKIIDQIGRDILKNCIKTEDCKLKTSYYNNGGMSPQLKTIADSLPMINNCLKLIDRELPPELKSVKAFVEFYNNDKIGSSKKDDALEKKQFPQLIDK